MNDRLLPYLAALALACPALAEPPPSAAAAIRDATSSGPQPVKAEPKPEPKEPEKSDKPAEPTLKLGDKAPALTGQTIKAEPIPPFESTKAYIVEFWATWCPSCRETIPKLKRLARNKDLSIIAVASSEKSPLKGTEDHRLEHVRQFVADRAEQMPFTVVFDGQRTIANDWLVAAHPTLPRYIPFAFVVDSTQTITWIGDPRRAEFDAAVEKALKPLAPPPAKSVAPEKKPEKPHPHTTRPKGN
jgi:thiol-disulfide isomerase/thioredoxin